MNKKERQEMNEQLLNIYCGILFHARQFEPGAEIAFRYDFDCPAFAELKRRYPIERIAGRGGDFERALRLCRWLAPRLLHKSDYDNHVPCNSLALLDYCFEKQDVGINCLNKAKVLAECCLALGIYARRLCLLPQSPYDMDSHVVTEVYDRRLSKWVVLDPTTGGYFSNGREPLSCLEVREAFAEMAPVSIVLNRQNPKNLDAIQQRNLEDNWYYAKNHYYFTVETVSTFGEQESAKWGRLSPCGLDLARLRAKADRYKVETAKKWGMDESLIQLLEEQCKKAEEGEGSNLVGGSTAMWDSPVA